MTWVRRTARDIYGGFDYMISEHPFVSMGIFYVTFLFFVAVFG